MLEKEEDAKLIEQLAEAIAELISESDRLVRVKIESDSVEYFSRI